MTDYDDPTEQGPPVVHLVIGDPKDVDSPAARALGKAHDAAMTLDEAVRLLDPDGPQTMLRARLSQLERALRQVVAEADRGGSLK